MSVKFRVSSAVPTMKVRELVRQTANFTPLLAEPLCVCCYHRLLEDVFELEPIYSDFRETVGEVASRYPDHKLIIRMEGHLTCSLYGVVADIWDCSEELVDRYWVV